LLRRAASRIKAAAAAERARCAALQLSGGDSAAAGDRRVLLDSAEGVGVPGSKHRNPAQTGVVLGGLLHYHGPRPNHRASQPGGDRLLVHTLACEQHVWFAIPCLRSLLAFSQDPIELVIHDDGSLTQRSFELLAAAFPDAVLVPRASADEEMAGALARFPEMAQARRHLPHVIKLCDVALIQPESIVRYVDTDVLFQRRFRGLFPAADESASGAFMMDSGNSFGAHPGDFWPAGPLRVARCLNSGLFWIRRDRIDYERMEFLFKRWGPQRIRKYHGWFEQTVWADQAWRSRCSMYDPAQFGTASAAESANDKLIGVHYVTPTRSMLKAALESASAPAAATADSSLEAAEEIRVLPSKPFGILGATLVAGRAVVSGRQSG
jgi:hypothetical protein